MLCPERDLPFGLKGDSLRSEKLYLGRSCVLMACRARWSVCRVNFRSFCRLEIVAISTVRPLPPQLSKRSLVTKHAEAATNSPVQRALTRRPKFNCQWHTAAARIRQAQEALTEIGSKHEDNEATAQTYQRLLHVTFRDG